MYRSSRWKVTGAKTLLFSVNAGQGVNRRNPASKLVGEIMPVPLLCIHTKIQTKCMASTQIQLCRKNATTTKTDIAKIIPKFDDFSRTLLSIGNIQGDGRKFLDRFKSHWYLSWVSSHKYHHDWLNEVLIYRLQPKSATKGDFFLIYFCLWFLSRWRHGLQMANEADEVLLGKRPSYEINYGNYKPRKMYWRKNCNLRTLGREYDCLAKIGTMRKRLRCYWETSKGNMRRLELTIKDKNIWKNWPLLRILAVIGGYGSHLMIVMIFVTQNNL